MSDILNIGRTALNAAQAGLSVTGHNIANASTPATHVKKLYKLPR